MATNEVRKSIREMLAIITLMAMDLPTEIIFRERRGTIELIFPTIAQALAWAAAWDAPQESLHFDQAGLHNQLSRFWTTVERHGWQVTVWGEEESNPVASQLSPDTIADLTEATGEQA